MKAVYFPGANDIILRPIGSTKEQCDNVIVHIGLDNQTNWSVITLCFKPDPAELEEFIRTGGVIYLQMYGPAMPPVSITPYNPIEQGWVVNGMTYHSHHPEFQEAKQKHLAEQSMPPKERVNSAISFLREKGIIEDEAKDLVIMKDGNQHSLVGLLIEFKMV